MELSNAVLDREKAKFREVSSGTATVNVIQTPKSFKLLNGTTSAGTSDVIDVVDFGNHTLVATVTQGAATVNGTVIVEGSLNNSTWVEIINPTPLIGTGIATELNGTTSTRYRYMRALMPFYTGGTVTIDLLSGN